MTSSFVGRAHEVAELAALPGRARSEGGPAAGLIEGEPGSGKTWLLVEAARRSAQEEVIALAGFEPSQRIPLAAAGPLLRRLATVPEHGSLVDRLAFGNAPSEARDALRLFEAAHRAAITQGPMLLTVDDVQWVDEQSLALIDYLVRAGESARQRLVILAAARPSPESATLRASVESSISGERRVAVSLGPLPLDDGMAIARSIDASLTAADAEELWRRARGSPFWLAALARSGGAEDPSNIVGGRLRSLSVDAGTLLGALAVLARPTPVDDVAGVLGWVVERAEKATRELVARGLVHATTRGLGPAHDLIREAAASGLPAASRRRLGVRVADWLESTAGDDLQLLCEALGHRLLLGLPAAELAAQILESPRRRLLGPENLRTLASISDALPGGSREQASIDRNLGELAALLGEQGLALARWVRVARHADDEDLRERAEVEAGRAAYRLGRPADAHAHLDRALEVGIATDQSTARRDALRAEILLWSDHRTEAGARVAERALIHARSMVAAAGGVERLDPDQRATYLAALQAAVGAALQEERIGDVHSLTAEGLKIGATDEESRVAMLLRAGFALRPISAGRVSEAEAHFRAAWDISRRIVLPLATLEAGRGLSRALRDLGRLAESRSITVETLELESRLGNPMAIWGNGDSHLHLIDLSMGRADALAALQADAEAEPNPHYRLSIHMQVGAWLARAAGPARAGEVSHAFSAARSAADLAACPRCAAEVSIVAAEAFARIGRTDDARQELATWEQRPIADYPARAIWRHRAQAAIAIAAGETMAAISLLEELETAIREAGYLEDLVWIQLDLGRARSGVDRAAAVQALESAAALAEQIGALALVRLAAQELRRLGVRAWRRGRTSTGMGSASLSGREREVADLVSQGRSNREIADTLLVAPKTIERHVTNILAKLGARNRTELAARFRAPGTGFPR